MTWLTALLIAWAAGTLGLLIGAMMCAAGRSDARVAADAQTLDDATAGATDTAPVQPETSAYDDAIVPPRLAPCPRCRKAPLYYYDGNGNVKLECPSCGFGTTFHAVDEDDRRALEVEWQSKALNPPNDE